MPPNQTKWTDEHDRVLLRALVASVLATRRALYTTPGLEDVAGNGGSRINQRIQHMLRVMGQPFPLDERALVAEEVARNTPRSARTPKKAKKEEKPSVSPSPAPSSKKRRVKEESDDEYD